MEEVNKDNKKYEDLSRPGLVHFLLAHTYSMFFLAIILGIIFDIVTGIRLLDDFAYSKFGIIFVFFGTGLAYWAQTSSSKASKIIKEKNNSEGFAIGPYLYFRHPTYLGLFTMTLGLGLLTNSIFSILFVLIAHLLIKLVFIKKEEEILEQKYGEIYTNYKQKIKNIA